MTDAAAADQPTNQPNQLDFWERAYSGFHKWDASYEGCVADRVSGDEIYTM